MAIEDSAALARALGRAFGVTGEFAQPSDSRALRAQLGACLDEYEQPRMVRVGRCERVTGFTRALVAVPKLCELLRFVPRRLNTYVFDQFLALSLGGTDPLVTQHVSPLRAIS